MDLEKVYLEWMPRIREQVMVKCEDEELTRLVHSLLCKELDLRERAGSLERNDEALYREIFEDENNGRYMKVRSKINETRPLVEIIEAITSYAISLDRIERKLDELRVGMPEEWNGQGEFRGQLDARVKKFMKARPEEKRNRALAIHCFCRNYCEPWPDEVVEALMCVLDTEAGRRVPDWSKGQATREIKGYRKEQFWWEVYTYVRREQAKGLSQRRALMEFHGEGKHISYLGYIEFDTFREYFRKNTKP